MVSLSPSNSVRQQGGRFFDPDTSATHTMSTDGDEPLLDGGSLSAHMEPSFKSINTVPVVIIQGVVKLLLLLLSFLLPAQYDPTRAYPWLVYLHSALWFLTFLTDRFVRQQHQTSRKSGYLDFYRQTRLIRKIPLIIISIGNSLLLVVVMVIHQFCEDQPCGQVPIKPANYLQLIICLEAVVILPCLIIYLVKTMKFNRSRQPADIHQDEMLSSFMQSHISHDQVGFRDTDYIDDILEKQADMIRYLRQQNENLAKKLQRLSTELHHQQV